MKKWIVEKFAVISEITGGEIPGWVRRLLDEKELEVLERRERKITESLRMKGTNTARIPDTLKERLDAVIAGQEREESQPPAKLISLPAWTAAVAALVLFGIAAYYLVPAGGVFIENERTPVATVEQHRERNGIPEIRRIDRDSLSGDLLLQPLTKEQERLAADMTNALQFVAQSLLPAEYARQVNDNLESLEQRIVKSI